VLCLLGKALDVLSRVGDSNRQPLTCPREHIYRCHRVPIHCEICWMVFNSKDLLKSHLRDVVNRCQVQPEQVFDGITPEIKKLLRSRKKEYRDQSEPELWKRMYRILFPDEFVPSPCKLVLSDFRFAFHYVLHIAQRSPTRN
jgi:hypothetical protein